MTTRRKDNLSVAHAKPAATPRCVCLPHRPSLRTTLSHLKTNPLWNENHYRDKPQTTDKATDGWSHTVADSGFTWLDPLPKDSQIDTCKLNSCCFLPLAAWLKPPSNQSPGSATDHIHQRVNTDTSTSQHQIRWRWIMRDDARRINTIRLLMRLRLFVFEGDDIPSK